MVKKVKDTDYLVISARIREMENKLLTWERMERILDARSDEELTKLLQEYGYPKLDASNPKAMDEALAAVRKTTLSDLRDGIPDVRYIDIFKLKYDYHNIKTILKAEAMHTDPDHLLMDMGRVDAAELKRAIWSDELDVLTPRLSTAVAEAREVLNTTRDPQLSDVLLDHCYYRDLQDMAEDIGSNFLQEYIKVQIDAVNLRTLVRALRMGKNTDFLRGVLFNGGTIAADDILRVGAANGSGLAELYAYTLLQDAAKSGIDALKGTTLTEFEKLCDDAVVEYLSKAQLVPFGEAPLISYLAARETEYTNLRILLLGRSAGLSPEVIRSRLRKSYA